jgi:hypothetical protein
MRKPSIEHDMVAILSFLLTVTVLLEILYG